MWVTKTTTHMLLFTTSAIVHICVDLLHKISVEYIEICSCSVTKCAGAVINSVNPLRLPTPHCARKYSRRRAR